MAILEKAADWFLKDHGYNSAGNQLAETDEIQEAFERRLAKIRGRGEVPLSDFLQQAASDAKIDVAIAAL